jgi:metal-responsive CopG/Arc/MetJ family transcriptional regulator
MMRTVARKQVLVQLDDAQLARLDGLAENVDESRSELIRRAIGLYLEAIDEAVEDVRYAEAYRRVPEDTDAIGAFQAVAVWPDP